MHRLIFALVSAATLFAVPSHAQWPEPDPWLSAYRGSSIDPNQHLLRSADADGLVVRDLWRGSNGCYVACYAHRPGVYDVGPFGVHGIMRVPGRYPTEVASNVTADRICQPRGFEYQDISALGRFKDLCNAFIPSCRGGCWAGGDTGGFFARGSYVPKPAHATRAARGFARTIQQQH